MIHCMKNGDLEGMEKLIENGFDIQQHYPPNACPPLMWALGAEMIEEDAAKLLIEKGANLNAQDRYDKTPLMYACENNLFESVKLLVEKGADINMESYTGWTALIYACKFKNTEIAKFLIEKGAKLDSQPNKQSALILCCSNNMPEIARLLVEKGVNIDFQLKEEQTSALMEACKSNNSEAAIFLIHKGANVNLLDDKRMSALMYACQYGRWETLQQLIQHGADANLQNNEGWSGLMLACQKPVKDCSPEAMLKCVQICYTAGSQLDLSVTCKNIYDYTYKHIEHGDSAIEIARKFESHEVTAFLEFVSGENPVVGVLQNALKLDRNIVNLFYEQGIVTVEDCCDLDDCDLESLGISVDSQKFKNSFMVFNGDSELFDLIVNKLKFDKSILESFLKEGISSVEDCKKLDDKDLTKLGISKLADRKKLKKELSQPLTKNDTAAPTVSQPVESMTERITRKFSMTSNVEYDYSKFEFDVFLTHDWGVDELGRNNHDRVSYFNNLLKLKFKTWFDEDRLSGNILKQMANGIEKSKVIVVFITRRYMTKVDSVEEDNCKSEFMHATMKRGVKNMLFVVMEPSMRDQKTWDGALALKASQELYIDCSADDEASLPIEKLYERIHQKVIEIEESSK